MKRWAAGTALALALCVGGAQAQISASGGPIDITADSLEVVEAQRVQRWRGKVEALQGQNRLRADAIDVFHGTGAGGARPTNAAPGTGWGEIDRLEAVGGVYFVTPQQVARGDKAVYTTATDTIVITGNVVIAQGENVLRGDRLTIEVASGRSTMDAGPGGGPGERVRGVFYPGKQGGR
ncbi:MAG TPA: LptA/OstA family protein [Caulobacteraceae bacterium]|nr:LptA/OstA family protein [Caulobacteraceae bacterium]